MEVMRSRTVVEQRDTGTWRSHMAGVKDTIPSPLKKLLLFLYIVTAKVGLRPIKSS